jgi:hypothetical protein
VTPAVVVGAPEVRHPDVKPGISKHECYVNVTM